MPSKSTTEEFIEKAKKIHKNDKVPPTYDKVEYVNCRTDVCITCPIHGDYWQKPKQHLEGKGCPICAYEKYKNTHGSGRAMTHEEFLEKANEKHKDKGYVYIGKYKNRRTPIEIICPKHGSFFQTPENHLKGKGCPLCGKKNTPYTTEEFITECKKIHGNNVIYDYAVYVNTQTKVELICPIHGVFYQKAGHHLQGHGCPLCKSSLLENKVLTILNETKTQFSVQKTFDWLIDKNNLYVDFYIQDFSLIIECQGKQHIKEIKYFGGKEGFEDRLRKDLIKKELTEKHNMSILYIFPNDVNISKVIEDYPTIYNQDNTINISCFLTWLQNKKGEGN